jgi:hypothetical protein
MGLIERASLYLQTDVTRKEMEEKEEVQDDRSRWTGLVAADPT